MHSSCKVRKSLRNRLRRRAQFLALLLGTLPVASNAFGQSYWASTNGGLWAATNVWSTDATSPAGTSFIGPSALPSLTRAAIFNTNGNNNTQTVSLNGNRDALGITMQSTGGITLRANNAGTTVRNLTIGSGGITVNVGAGSSQATPTFSIAMSTASGQSNTLLFASQTWTNNSDLPIDWNSRLIGHESVTFVKAGTGNLILRGANQGQAATINGTLSTGMRGKVVVAEGTLTIGQANALGIADALTTEMSSGALNLVSDTTIQNGAVYQVNNTAVATEFVTFQGSGIGGAGAIVNNATNTGITGNNLAQVRMSGDATVGGSSRFDFRTNIEEGGRFFQDGFTLTKTGASTVGIVNTLMIGGGNINVAQGELRFEQTSTLTGSGTVTVQSGGTIGFNNVTGSITRPIVLEAGGRIFQSNNDTTTAINSDVTINGAGVIFQSNDNNNATAQGTLNILGTVRSNGQDLVKTGSGRLGVTLDPSTFTGNLISIQGGTVDLETTGAGITASIFVAGSSTLGTVFRPGIGGEGQTSGTLTFDTGTNGNGRIWFDGSTTGANQHLRVGGVNTNSNVVDTILIKPAPAGTGIVVFESSAPGSINSSEYRFLGRGTLSANGAGTQLLLDYSPANLVWRGNDATDPTFFNLQTSTNWVNGANPDLFFDGDIVRFDDTNTGSTTIIPIDQVNPGGVVFNNNTVNYTLGGSTAGVVSAGLVSLTKSGTGTVTIATAPGSVGHVFGQTSVNQGLLNITYNNPNNANTGAAVTSILGNLNAGTTIANSATLRSIVNVNNTGIGNNPVNVAAGGVLEFIRGAVPNGTNTGATATAIASPFSGAGDIVFTGIQDTSPLPIVDSYGGYTLNSNAAGFTGRMVLNNARINTDNGLGVDELGGATIVVNPGSQALLSAAATLPFENNVFRIAGTGWTFDPINNVGGSGALRFNAGSVIAANSSVILDADNTRINAQNQTGRINAVIDDGANTFSLEIGNPGATQNGNLVLAGANTYGGSTNIVNHLVMANNNGAFSTGQVNINGVTSARTTNISIGNGITINNPITMTSAAGLGGSRGVIEGGRTLQVTDLGAGVGTVAGQVNLPGSLVNSWAHFSGGEGAGSILRVTGQVISADGYVQARSQAAGSLVEFANSNNQITKFDLALGTVRLGANNTLGSGAELVTRRVADAGGATGVLDMNNFDQTVSHVTRGSTLTTANFTLTNTGTGVSTLTINGTSNSDIQNIAAGANGGVVNIVKNGAGNLVLSGGTLSNAGVYTINGGNLQITSGNVAAGVNITNSSTVISGGGQISGAVTLPTTGISLSPGNSTDTLTFNSAVALPNNSTLNWEILAAGTNVTDLTTLSTGADNDIVAFNGGLDLTAVQPGGLTVTVSSIISENPTTAGALAGFDPNLNYNWLLFDNSALTGFNPNQFVLNTTPFVTANPNAIATNFSVVQLGTDVVLQYAAIPEPTSFALLACMSLGVIGYRSRRSNRSQNDE